jgi:hypothetical protein
MTPLEEQAREIADKYPGHHPMSNQSERLAKEIAAFGKRCAQEEREAIKKFCDESDPHAMSADIELVKHYLVLRSQAIRQQDQIGGGR